MNEQSQSAPSKRCIVCTKKIQPSEEHVRVHHGGTEYAVCCASCAQKFEAQPALYTVS